MLGVYRNGKKYKYKYKMILLLTNVYKKDTICDRDRIYIERKSLLQKEVFTSVTRDRGATLTFGGGGGGAAPLVTQYWGGGHKSLFLTNSL